MDTGPGLGASSAEGLCCKPALLFFHQLLVSKLQLKGSSCGFSLMINVPGKSPSTSGSAQTAFLPGPKPADIIHGKG